jgi:hypothetical protein
MLPTICALIRSRRLAPSLLAAALLAASTAPAAAQEQAARPDAAEQVDARGDGVGTFATPDLVSDSWNLTTRLGEPNTIALTGADGSVTWFWYLPYMIQNDTGQEVLYVPEAQVLTSDGRLITAGRGVPDSVYQAIRVEENNDLIESHTQAAGPLLQGVDHAVDSAVVWAAPDEDVDRFTLFIGGLSGETEPILDPLTGEPMMAVATDIISGEPVMGPGGEPLREPVLARKTLMLTYDAPGTRENLQDQPARLIERRQIMR